MRYVLLIVVLATRFIVAPHGVLPEGTRLVARMNTTIGTTRSLAVDRVADETRAGAPFRATVDAPVVDEAGRVQLAGGALLRGHVARLSRGVGVRGAVIELAVDELDGHPLRATVVEIEVQQLPRLDAGVPTDANAFWGALIGGIAFGVPGVVVGYGFGGSSGAVAATRARVVEGWISAGSLITVELEKPLPLGGCYAARDDGRC